MLHFVACSLIQMKLWYWSKMGNCLQAHQNVTTLSLPIIAAIIGILTITMILIIAGAIVMNRLRNVHINTRDLQATPVHNNAYESGPPDSRVATISANAGNIQFFNNPYYR